MRDCLLFHPKENQRSVNLPKWKRHSGWVYSRFHRIIASILCPIFQSYPKALVSVLADFLPTVSDFQASTFSGQDILVAF